MFDRIFVAFDGSSESRRACDVAIEIASRFHSSVTVATVHPSSKESADLRLQSLVPIGPEGKSLAMLIEELQGSARSRGVPSLEPVFLQGDVLPALLRFLHGHPHDLAIAGSRGLTRGQRLLMGSISTGLVSEAPCPVLIVRGARAGAASREPPSGRPPSRH